MSTPAASSTRSQQPTFSPNDRILQLVAIDSQIGILLQHAGQSLQALTSPEGTDIDSNKEAFLSHVTDYFTLLSSIDVSLRRQIYALQEAGLIQAGNARDARDAGNRFFRDGGGAIGGDEGPLEISWLNSRVRDTVGTGMERELWAQARELVLKNNDENP